MVRVSSAVLIVGIGQPPGAPTGVGEGRPPGRRGRPGPGRGPPRSPGRPLLPVFLGELLAVQPRVDPALGDQLGMRPALDDPAALVDEDPVGAQDRGQSVGDGDRGPALHQALEGGLDEPLRDSVERRGRLVEDQDPRVLEQHPGDRQALLLAARQLVAALADERVVALGELHDPLVDRGGAGGDLELLVGGVGARVAEVVADRGVEEVRLLGHGPDHLAERGELDPADIDVVDLDRARVDVVEARDEVGGRGLARA